jgi:hypothetical protein
LAPAAAVKDPPPFSRPKNQQNLPHPEPKTSNTKSRLSGLCLFDIAHQPSLAI